MKLLIISPGKFSVPAVEGGAVENLIQILIDNNEKSHDFDITLVSSDNKEAEKESQNYKNTSFIFIKTYGLVYKLSRAIRFLINRIPGVYIGNAYIHRVKNKLKKKFSSFDCVIVENQPEYSLVLKNKCKKLILHLHNDFLNSKTDSCKKILSAYAKVLAISDYINKRVSEINPKLKNVYTLYNGVDINKFNNALNKNAKKDSNIEENFIYMYTGRIVPEKGVIELIKAYNLINDNKTRLYIVGDLSSNTNYVKKIKAEANNNNKIIFTGKVKYDEIPYYYKLSDVGIIPSVWEEPFALTVIEHMAVGNPVIISESGAMPELINDKCAIVANKKENFVQNLRDSMVMIKKSYKQFDKNTIKKQAAKFNSNKYYKEFVKYIRSEENDKKGIS